MSRWLWGCALLACGPGGEPFSGTFGGANEGVPFTPTSGVAVKPSSTLFGPLELQFSNAGVTCAKHIESSGVYPHGVYVRLFVPKEDAGTYASIFVEVDTIETGHASSRGQSGGPLVVTTLDSSHVAGQMDFDTDAGTSLHGTFDVKRCP